MNNSEVEGNEGKEDGRIVVYDTNNMMQTNNYPLMSDWDDNNVVVIDLLEERSQDQRIRWVSGVSQEVETFPDNSTDKKTASPDQTNSAKDLLQSRQVEQYTNDDDQLNTRSQIPRRSTSEYGIQSTVDTLNGLPIDNARKTKQRLSIVSQNQKVEPELAPIKLRAWEKARSPSVSKEELDSNSLALTPVSFDNRQKLSFSMAKSGRKERPMSVICTSSSHHQGLLHLDHELKSPLVYRSVMRKWSAASGKNDFQFNSQKALSNDYLNWTENSISFRTRTRSSIGCTPSTSTSNATMTCIEKNLYLGNMEAATDVILLESNAITHIISVDSVPLPRKISSILPRIIFKHLQISDLPNEDLLSSLVEAVDFIEVAVAKGGVVLVHCFKGRSRSATVVIAYLMHKHRYTLEKAFYKVKNKREMINPHIGFLAQLKMFEAMDYTLDPGNVQYKMFRLFCASERMRKAKILFRDSLDKVLDTDPAGGLPGSAEAAAAAASKNHYPMIFKCRKCKRTLASAFNMLPHVKGETPNWMDSKWARLTEEDILDDASSPAGLDLCSQSVFITPVSWMEHEIKQNLSGKLYCPNCPAKVGSYSWILGDLCKGCGAVVLPAFQLDMTEIIFRTHNRYLQSGCTSRGPILV